MIVNSTLSKIALSLFSIIACHTGSLGQCTIVGPNGPSSSANSNSIGTSSWSDFSNSQLSDNSYATAGQFVSAFSVVNSNYLVATNFGFNIPIEDANNHKPTDQSE